MVIVHIVLRVHARYERRFARVHEFLPHDVGSGVTYEIDEALGGEGRVELALLHALIPWLAVVPLGDVFVVELEHDLRVDEEPRVCLDLLLDLFVLADVISLIHFVEL